MNLQQIKSMQADEKGIIVLNIEGRERKFVKEKLVRHLETTSTTEDCKLPPVVAFKIPTVKMRKELTRKKDIKPRIKKPQPEVKLPRGKCQCKPVVAIFPDGREQEFPSGMDAAKGTGVYKSGVSRILNSTLAHVKNIVFKFKTEM